MRLPDFQVEQWMNEYEHQALYNLTDTSASSISFGELSALEPGVLDDVTLDYGYITGDRNLREQILCFYKNRDPKTLTLSAGCLQGNEMVMETLLEPGDHVICFKPGYQQFWDMPASLGCEVTQIPLNPEDWSLELSLVEKAVTPQTKLIILNNPSNPTGAVLEKEQLEKLAEIAGRYGIWILCDEVYWLGQSQIPSVSDIYEKGISTCSLSKVFGLPALRLGWIKGNPSLIEKINVRRDYSIISTGPVQDTLAWIALKHKNVFIAEAFRRIERNKKTIEKWLKSQDLFECILPDYGTVAFLHCKKPVASDAFSKSLLKDTGIFMVPGTCFDMEGYFRLGLAKEHENLESVLNRLLEFSQNWINTAN